MVIAFLPMVLIKRPAPPVPGDSTAVAAGDSSTIGLGDSTGVDTGALGPGAASQAAEPTVVPRDTGAAVAQQVDSSGASTLLPGDTVVVSSPLYSYRISTRGGELVGATFNKYRSMSTEDSAANGSGGRPAAELIPDGEPMLATRIVSGDQQVLLSQVAFSSDVDSLVLSGDSARTLTLTGNVAGRPVSLSYTFHPDKYRIEIAGSVAGVSANGGTLFVGMGNGFRNTESQLKENERESGVVTESNGTELTHYRKLDPGESRTLTGPFQWVAVKSKYFVGGLFAVDSTGQPRITSASLTSLDKVTDPVVTARTEVAMPITSVGSWQAMLYLGPMEYDRLNAIGYDFGDVNPYGWKGLRTIIRPFAVAIRAILVWVHRTLGLHYGLAIILLGVLIRLMLWPLNQKAMRSMTEMQAIQPEMQELQAKFKQQPEKLQKEMVKLYREHKVNPLSGCWPMLLPYPFLVAVFFVLQSTIELRGVSFLWMPDLSRPDPLYIIPVFMVLSMFALSKIGQMGIPPNPQAKIMTYVMPAVFGFLFLNFASGLNLYYAVQNIAAAPQQYLISKQRVRILADKQRKREKKGRG